MPVCALTKGGGHYVLRWRGRGRSRHRAHRTGHRGCQWRAAPSAPLASARSRHESSLWRRRVGADPAGCVAARLAPQQLRRVCRALCGAARRPPAAGGRDRTSPLGRGPRGRSPAVARAQAGAHRRQPVRGERQSGCGRTAQRGASACLAQAGRRRRAPSRRTGRRGGCLGGTTAEPGEGLTLPVPGSRSSHAGTQAGRGFRVDCRTLVESADRTYESVDTAFWQKGNGHGSRRTGSAVATPGPNATERDTHGWRRASRPSAREGARTSGKKSASGR